MIYILFLYIKLSFYKFYWSTILGAKLLLDAKFPTLYINCTNAFYICKNPKKILEFYANIYAGIIFSNI